MPEKECDMFKTRSLALACAAVMLLSLALVAAPALAQEEWQPYALTAGGQIGSSLPGSRAGSFDDYVLAYPGGMAEVAVRVTFMGIDPSFGSAVGFNVYGGDAFDRGRGEEKEDGAYLEFSHQAEDPATLAVQVFNYSDHTVAYTIEVIGLADVEPVDGEPVVEAAAPEAPVVDDAVEEPVVPLSGLLVGSPAGTFGMHTFSYPGDESDLTVTMTAPPLDPSFAGTTGFKIYDPAGHLVAEGTLRATLWERDATLSSDVAGEYLVLVYNYAEGMELSYTLTIGD
jgi:hypothetical protein